MGIIQTMLRQQATYWPTAGLDEFGEAIGGTPEIVKVRWEDKSMVFSDGVGDQKISNAVVYVEKDLEVGGWLFLGLHISLPAPMTMPEYLGYGVNKRENPDYAEAMAMQQKGTGKRKQPTKFGRAHMGLRTTKKGRQRLRDAMPIEEPNVVLKLSAQAPGTVEDGIYQIAKFEKTPNLKATQTLRVAIL